jgi:hypothetical protein
MLISLHHFFSFIVSIVEYLMKSSLEEEEKALSFLVFLDNLKGNLDV